MCIIVAKEQGIKMPKKKILKNCWNNNSDGAGFMYNDNGNVIISKGYMNFDDFYNAVTGIDNAYNKAIVMHFRITTHGGTSASNTHPFPISSSESDLKRLHNKTDIGVAHNGIIDIEQKKNATISDTMQFIKDELYYINKEVSDWYLIDSIIDLIEYRIGSKLAILNELGRIVLIGDFITDNGIYYSNNSYSYTGYYNYNSLFDSETYPINYSDDYNYTFGYYYSDMEMLTGYSKEMIQTLEELGLIGVEIEDISSYYTESELKELHDEMGYNMLSMLVDSLYRY